MSGLTAAQDMLGRETTAAAEVEQLWSEYEEGTTAEAQLVKDFDKLEMIVQVRACMRVDRGWLLAVVLHVCGEDMV